MCADLERFTLLCPLWVLVYTGAVYTCPPRFFLQSAERIWLARIWSGGAHQKNKINKNPIKSDKIRKYLIISENIRSSVQIPPLGCDS